MINSSAISDEALIAGISAGDKSSFTCLIRRYQDRVFGLAVTICGDEKLAEDIAQETFLKLWRFASNFDPRKGSVKSWLLTMTRNAAIDILRLEGRLDLKALSDFVTYSRFVLSPDGEAEASDTVTSLRSILNELPQEQSGALLLASYWGLTMKEIADIQKVPVSTVKTRIRLAIGKLRKRLEIGYK